MSKVHIGQRIKSVVKASGLTVTEFGKLINLTRDGVYKVYRKEYLDTALLNSICKVLRYDFFHDYSKGLDFTKDPVQPFGYATRDDLGQVFLLLEKMNRRLDQLEQNIQASPHEKGSKKYRPQSRKKDR